MYPMTRSVVFLVANVVFSACVAPSAYRRATALKEADTIDVIAALKDPNWKVAASAAQVLGARRDDKAVGPLLDVMSTGSDWKVRAYAASALGNFPAEPVVAGLSKAARDDLELGVREEAVGALGAMRNLDLSVFLIGLTLDSERTVRQRAEDALTPLFTNYSENRNAAALLASGQDGDLTWAIAFWTALLKQNGEPKAPAIRAEIKRISLVETERRDERQRLSDERDAAALKASKEAAARAARERSEREERAIGALARAFSLLMEGAFEEAAKEGQAAERDGANVEEFTKQLAAKAFRRARADLSAGRIDQALSGYKLGDPRGVESAALRNGIAAALLRRAMGKVGKAGPDEGEADAQQAKDLGWDVGAFERRVADNEWQLVRGTFTGQQLAAYMERWGEYAPSVARNKFKHEEAVRAKEAARKREARDRWNGSWMSATVHETPMGSAVNDCTLNFDSGRAQATRGFFPPAAYRGQHQQIFSDSFGTACGDDSCTQIELLGDGGAFRHRVEQVGRRGAQSGYPRGLCILVTGSTLRCTFSPLYVEMTSCDARFMPASEARALIETLRSK